MTCEVTDVMAICNIHTATASKSADTRLGPGLVTPLLQALIRAHAALHALIQVASLSFPLHTHTFQKAINGIVILVLTLKQFYLIFL